MACPADGMNGTPGMRRNRRTSAYTGGVEVKCINFRNAAERFSGRGVSNFMPAQSE